MATIRELLHQNQITTITQEMGLDQHGPRVFHGISRAGAIVEGIEFSDGRCATRWLPGTPTTLYDSIDEVRAHVETLNRGTRLNSYGPYVFYLDRRTDVSGLSGTGIVAEGIEFSDGQCAIRWLSGTPTTTFYDSIEDLQKIHGHGGNTILKWEGGDEV